MNLNRLSEMIYKRRSVRKYKKGAPFEGVLSDIAAAFGELKPLYAGIRYELKLVARDEVRTLMPWMPEYAIALFSEPCEGYLENAGFVLEQLDLYIQSLGLGSCWVGLARPKRRELIPDGMEFVMLIAFGESDVAERSGAGDFKRRDMAEITDLPTPRLEPARLAPSSVNSQPWYFAACEGGYLVYRRKLVRTSGLTRMNFVDVGIALSHIFISNPDVFGAQRCANAPEREGMEYITTLSLG